MTDNTEASQPKKEPKSEKQKSNKAGTRASHILREMPPFQEQIEVIKDRWETYENKGQEALQALIEIGRNLHQVREWVDNHNEEASKDRALAWDQWCQRDLPFGKRQANRYIKVWKNADKIKFSEDEKVSVRAAIEMVTSGKRKGRKGIKPVVRGKGVLKSKIEAGPTGGVARGGKDHRIRLTWRDDEIGELLHKKGEKAVTPEDSETLAGACARLFSLALAIDENQSQIGKRICRAIRNLPATPRNAEALAAIAQALEFRGVAVQPTRRYGDHPGTGGTGMTGPMPPYEHGTGMTGTG